ncbi:MAG: ribosome biogenesis GTP-binding protein YihA/YsxC [Alphaproteobacteria bacterium]|nr:ribosome biogenesis GTP-binding protein YihA/YsxC [Alphaproteobacteria bacterium]
MTDQTYSMEQIQKGDMLFKKPCRFMLGVATLDALPDMYAPEIAFAGRSNVGKSSLINALFNNHSVARVSNTPGRTQQLNYFSLDQDRLYLVDMPGYGFAQAPKSMVQQWQHLIRQYLLGRQTLERVYVLIDSRHGLKKNDTEFMVLLDGAGVSYQLVLTKIDKITSSACQYLEAQTTEILKKHGAAHPVLLKTSSEKRIGLAELRAEIAQFCKD